MIEDFLHTDGYRLYRTTHTLSCLSLSMSEDIRGQCWSSTRRPWGDLDAHLAVFHESNRKRVSPATQLGTSSIQQEETELLRHVKVLKRGRPGSAKYRAAVKALGIGQEPKGDTSRGKVNTADPKERSGV